MSKKDKPHYVNNADFSAAVVEYVQSVRDEEQEGNPAPVVPNYIAESFLKICEGLSHKHNFLRYPFREEMVMDAVENCLRAVQNYDITKATRTKKPNAFSYFTQIAWFAFLRRIAKEKKDENTKLEYMIKMGAENFIVGAEDTVNPENEFFVENLKQRIDKVKTSDSEFKDFKKEKRRQRRIKVDSDLSEFIG